MPGLLRLTLKSEKETREYLVTPENGALIGRKSDCDIVVLDTTASRHHARVEIVDDAWHLRDMNSANGTKLNGQPVSLSKLKTGDEIKIGQTTITVAVEEQVPVGKKPSFSTIPVPEGVLPTDGRPAPPQRKDTLKPDRKRLDSRLGRYTQRDKVQDEGETRRGSRRSKRSETADKPFYLQAPFFAGLGIAVLAAIVVIALGLGDGSETKLPPPKPTNEEQRKAEMNSAEALYSEAFNLRTSGRYQDALAKVREARSTYELLMQKYPTETWLETKFTTLCQWERQLGEIEFARGNAENRQGR